MRACICCGNTYPPTHYRATGAAICVLCDVLSPDDIARTARATAAAEHRAATLTRQGRRDATVQAALARYRAAGKVCAVCRVPKPIDAFAQSRARFDGLQPACRACHALHRQISAQPAGATIWRELRRALRARSDAASSSADQA